jgi:outer membrane protein assembly factor BamB
MMMGSRSVSILIVLLMAMSVAIPVASATVEPDVFRSGCGRFQSLHVGDVDGDGNTELLFGTYEGVIVQLQHRAGDFTVEWESPDHSERAWGLTVGDCDDDGDNEIVVGDGEGDLFVYDAITHDLEWKRQGQMVRDAHGLVIADLEGDGTTEVLVGTGYKTDQGWGTLYVWAGDGSSDVPLRTYGPYDSRLRGIQVVDVDDDGEKEIVFGSGVNLGDIEGQGFLRVLDAATGELEWESEDHGGDIQGVEVYDTDLDERPNIVVGTGYRYREGHVAVLQYNPASETYEEQWRTGNIGPKAWGVAVGDVEGDGSVEIVVGNQPGYIRILDASSGTVEWESELLGTDIFGMKLADVDGDGRTDIVAAQGGYQGKGDFTSGYSDPHIYIIDGETREFTYVLGERDLQGVLLTGVLLLLVLVALILINILAKDRKAVRDAAKAAEEAAKAQGPGGRTDGEDDGMGGVPGWSVDLGDDDQAEAEPPPPPDGGAGQ